MPEDAKREGPTHNLAMFRVEFSERAQDAIAKFVPSSVIERVTEMLRAIGETALDLARVNGLPLGGDKFSHNLTCDRFHFFYMLDLEDRCITVFSVVPNMKATG